MHKYFVRVDYIYKGSPVQRVRLLCDTFASARKYIAQYCGPDYFVLCARIERCS